MWEVRGWVRGSKPVVQNVKGGQRAQSRKGGVEVAGSEAEVKELLRIYSS